MDTPKSKSEISRQIGEGNPILNSLTNRTKILSYKMQILNLMTPPKATWNATPNIIVSSGLQIAINLLNDALRQPADTGLLYV